MDNDSPQKALLMVFSVALLCSLLVSAAAIVLAPIQAKNALVERSRNIVGLTGLVPECKSLTTDEVLEAVKQLDLRVVDLATGAFNADIDPAEFDARAAAADPELSDAIPADQDIAGLGQRPRFETVYLVWDGDAIARVILPISGQGMWSTLYGYLALQDDFNTIAAATFYEQQETAGLGDQIMRAEWQRQWAGRRLYDDQGNFRFRVGPGTIEEASPLALHNVDGLTGATVTGDAVTRLVEFWFGPSGYQPFLEALRDGPPARQTG